MYNYFRVPKYIIDATKIMVAWPHGGFMKIGIIDADLIGRDKHRFPNLACEKISGYWKEHGAEVALLMDYDHFEEYKARSILIGSEVTVIKLTESYPARVLGINPDYSLKISRDGVVEDLFTGEVSLRI